VARPNVIRSGQTIIDKLWDQHVVVSRNDGYDLLYIDRHMLHDGSELGFAKLRSRSERLRRPDRTFGTPDHYVPTVGRDLAVVADSDHRYFLKAIETNARREGFIAFTLNDRRQGIAHVVGPEQAVTLPGMTIVCGDSHTSTHGGLGALAFGIGTSEVAHVMATQCLWQRKPRTLRITVDGPLAQGVSAKDVALSVIRAIGTSGATGHIIEFAGSAIRSLSVEGRLTLCNMSIEAGAKAGLVAPDEVTFAYLSGRSFAPTGSQLEQAHAYWLALRSDPGSIFDKEVRLDGTVFSPMVTWGTSPEDSVSIDSVIPDPNEFSDATRRANARQSLEYMQLRPGERVRDIKVDRVFIGSCTNSRIEYLRSAAAIIRDRKVVVPAWVVAGSGGVKAQAEAEGLHTIFKEAGFEWREPGCSMCVGMNGDIGKPGERIASTSNRNFKGRQGPGVLTHLVSPAMACAAALNGCFTDVRELVRN